MAAVYPTPTIELMLDGVHWTDVTADVRITNGASMKYGMTDGKPTTRVASTGEAQFWLENSSHNSGGLEGYYSPNNANVRSGFKQNIKCRVSYTYSGITYYKWVGRLKDIVPLPGMNQERYTACGAVDYIDDLARANLTGLATQTTKTYDQLLTTLLAAMKTQPSSTSFDVGVSTFPYGLVGGSSGVINGLQECQRLAMSELAYVYVKGDQVAGGILRGENRHTRLLTLTSLSTLADTMRPPMDVPSSVDDVINSVQVTVHPRKVDAAAVVLYSSLTAQSSSPTLIASGQTITINGPYRDPTQTVSVGSARVAGTAMVNPVATTDYAANALADGTGADLTANISIVTTFGSTGATFAVTNNGASSAYLTKLQCRGIGLYDYDAAIAISEDSTSETTYGTNTLPFDMPYEADPLNGQGAADSVRIAWANPFGYAQKVSFIANTSDALMTAALAREIGDRVTIQETQTGVNADFFINGIDFHISEGPIITCTWILAPASAAAYWILGFSGNSELGLTTYLAPF